jgi:hypothetical protein
MTRRKVDEAALEAALARWTRAPVASEAGEAAACARIVAHGDDLASAMHPAVPPARRRRWPLVTAAAMAASVAAVVLVLPRPAGEPGGVPADPVAGAPEASFALLHSPTLEEEILF